MITLWYASALRWSPVWTGKQRFSLSPACFSRLLSPCLKFHLKDNVSLIYQEEYIIPQIYSTLCVWDTMAFPSILIQYLLQFKRKHLLSKADSFWELEWIEQVPCSGKVRQVNPLVALAWMSLLTIWSTCCCILNCSHIIQINILKFEILLIFNCSSDLTLTSFKIHTSS